MLRWDINVNESSLCPEDCPEEHLSEIESQAEGNNDIMLE